MINTIVTGVDDSETAARAAVKAAELGRALGATVHLVCAYGKFERETIQHHQGKISYTSERLAMRTAQKVAHKTSQLVPEVNLIPHAGAGEPGEALVRVADELEAELIVVGNKRVQGFGRILGSIARSVAAHASCDVYVAHTSEG